MIAVSHPRLLVVGILILAAAQVGTAWGDSTKEDGSDRVKPKTLEAQAAGGDIEAQWELADLYFVRGNNKGGI